MPYSFGAPILALTYLEAAAPPPAPAVDTSLKGGHPMSTGALPAARSAPGRAAPAAADPSAAAVASARRGVLAYLLVVIVLSSVVQAAILVTREMGLTIVLMWMP